MARHKCLLGGTSETGPKPAGKITLPFRLVLKNVQAIYAFPAKLDTWPGLRTGEESTLSGACAAGDRSGSAPLLNSNVTSRRWFRFLSAGCGCLRSFGSFGKFNVYIYIFLATQIDTAVVRDEDFRGVGFGRQRCQSIWARRMLGVIHAFSALGS